MTTRRFEIALTPTGCGRIALDGQKIPGVTGFTLTGEARRGITTLTVEVALHEGMASGEAIVLVPERTREALLVLGWTPPVSLVKETK